MKELNTEEIEAAMPFEEAPASEGREYDPPHGDVTEADAKDREIAENGGLEEG